MAQHHSAPEADGEFLRTDAYQGDRLAASTALKSLALTFRVPKAVGQFTGAIDGGPSMRSDVLLQGPRYHKEALCRLSARIRLRGVSLERGTRALQ